MDDHEEIRRTLALYAQLLDDRRFAECGQLFCSDAVLPWGGKVYTGRAEIVRGMPETQPPESERIKHFVFSPVIDVDGSEARVWADVIVAPVPATGPAVLAYVGRYHQRFRREDGRWRILSHVAVRTGDPIPEGEPPPPSR